jgi:hypothetical protein
VLSSPNRIVALATAVACIGVGIVALVTGRPWFAGILFVAVAGLVTAALLGMSPARRANIVAGTVWLALGIAGLFFIGTPANILGLVAADEVLLFAAATLQLAAGLGARRDQVEPAKAAPTPDTLSSLDPPEPA